MQMKSKPLNKSLRNKFVNFVIKKSEIAEKREKKTEELSNFTNSLTIENIFGKDVAKALELTPNYLKETILTSVCFYEDKPEHQYIKSYLDIYFVAKPFFAKQRMVYVKKPKTDPLIAELIKRKEELKLIDDEYYNFRQELITLIENCRNTKQLFAAWKDGEEIIKEFISTYMYNTGMPMVVVNTNLLNKSMGI